MGQLQTLAILPGFFIRDACKACFAKRREEKTKPAKRISTLIHGYTALNFPSNL